MAFLQGVMHGAGWQVRDAGGTTRGLYDYFQSAKDAPVPRRTLAAVRRECNRYEQTVGKRVLTASVTMFVFVAVASLIRDAVTGSSPLQLLVGVLWTVFVIAAAREYSRFIRCGPSAYAAELVAHGHCAACGYPLAKEEGELTTCPECGAVWTSAKVGAAVVEGTDVSVIQARRVEAR